MASNEIVLRVRTVGGKQVLELADSARTTRKEVDAASSSYTRLGQSAERAGKSASSVNHAKNARDMKNLRNEIGSGNNGLVGAYATLAVNTFAVVAAFTALQKATGAAKIVAGLEAQGARLGRTLSLTADSVRDLTDSAVSMADAMRSTAQLTAGGFDSKQIERLTVVAKDASGALGRDLADSMDRLARGVTKLEPELLDEMGIMTKLDEASNKYAISMNKSAASLTSAEKRQAFMNAVLEEGDRKFGGIGDKVDGYNSYTKLAAAATDNFNRAVGALAAVFAPVAEFLANNEWAFYGAILLFASSIREQLVPALTEAVERQQEIIKQSKTISTARFDNIASQSRVMESDMGGNIDTGAGQLLTIKNADEKARNLALFQRQYSSMTDEIKRGEEVLKSHTYATEQARQTDIAALSELRKNRDEVEALNTLRQTDIAQTAQLNAVQSAQKGHFREMTGALKEQFFALQRGSLGMRDYKENAFGAMSNLTALGTTAKNAGRVGVTAVKSVGIAFVEFMPYIAAAVMAFGLLVAAYESIKDALTSKAQKEYNKHMKDFSAILDEANPKIEEYNKLSKSSSAEAAISALQIQSNMVSELAEKYKELRVAREKAYNSEDESKAGPDKSIATAVDALKRDAGNTLDAKSWFSGLTQQTAVGAEALGKISEVSTKTTKEFIKVNLQAAAAAGSWEESEKILAQTLAIVESQIGSVALEAENLKEAFKNLEEASVKYGQSSIQKTPVDDLLKGFQQSNIAILRLQNSFRSGAIDAELFNKSLQAIGSSSITFLGEGAAKAKIEIDSLNSQIESMKKLDSSGLGFEGLKENIAGLEQERNSRAESFSKVLVESLNSTQQITREYQEQFRMSKHMQALETARYNKVKDLFNTGAAGARAQMEHEEKMRNFQIAQIALEKKLVDLQISSMKAQWDFQKGQFQIELDRLNETLRLQEEAYTKERSNVLDIQNLVMKGLKLRYSLEVALAQGAYDAFNSIWESALDRGDKEAEAAKQRVLAVQKEIDRRKEEQRIRELEHNNVIADVEAASRAMGLEIAAITEQNLSAEEKTATARKAGVELSKKYLEQATEYQKVIVATAQAVIKYNKAISGTEDEILDKRADIIQTYKEQTKSSRLNAASEIASLRAELDLAEAQANNNSLSEVGKTAAAETLEYLRDTLYNKELILQQTLQQVDAETKLALLQIAIFNPMTDGIKWQQEAVSMLQERLELSEKIRDAEVEIASSERRVRRLSRGLGDTEENQNNEAIRAATEQLRAAKVAASIRMQSINAEYALLHAQKEALTAELTARAQILSQDSNVSPEFLSGLNNSIALLAKVDYSAMAKEAQRATILGVDAAAQNLKEVLATTGSSVNGDSSVGRYMARMADRRENKEVKRGALEELNNNPLFTSLIELPTTLKASNEALSLSNTRTLKETFGPTSQIASDVHRIAEVVTGGGSSSYTGGLNIVEAGRHAEASGARVSEQSTWNNGKVETSGHSQGSRHYDDQAIDVNYVSGADADNTNAKAKMDKLAKDFQARGFRVLWNGNDYAPLSGISKIRGNQHRDHLHAEVPRTVVSRTGEMVEGGPSSVPAAATSTGEGAQAAANTYKDLTAANPDTKFSEVKGYTKTPMADPGMEQQSISVAAQGIESLSSRIKTFREDSGLAFEKLNELATTLGPEGEVILAVTSGIDNLGASMQANVGVIFGSLESIKDPMERTAARVTAIGSVMSSALSTIGSIMSAASDQRVRGIDAEIAAEQKRDGHSAASVAKIAEMEKRKEAIQRKQFSVNKKIMMAQAVIATATGITQALSYGPPGIPLAIAIGALGAAQLAIIASTSYQGGAAKTNAGKLSVPKMTIGRVGDNVNLDRANTNAGGEIGYLRGSAGYGTNANNYATIGSATGGSSTRGYGHRSFLVGENGPETLETDDAMNIKPINDAPIKQEGDIYIQATDADSFMKMLENNPEAIVKGVRKLANSSGTPFLESVDLNGFRATKK